MRLSQRVFQDVITLRECEELRDRGCRRDDIASLAGKRIACIVPAATIVRILNSELYTAVLSDKEITKSLEASAVMCFGYFTSFDDPFSLFDIGIQK
jgi:hypothetical protein